MSKSISMIALLGAVGLGAACSSDDGAATPSKPTTLSNTATPIDPPTQIDMGAATAPDPSAAPNADGVDPITLARWPSCGSDVNEICIPSGFPFVQTALAHSEACDGLCLAVPPAGTSIRLHQPEAGTLCLSGNNPAANTVVGLAFSVLSIDTPDYAKAEKLFNADVLGITQVRFSIDNPPAAGVRVTAVTIHALECNNYDCVTWGFALPNPITQSVTFTARLSDFRTEAAPVFDTRALGDISFEVGPGAFDFCIRDFQFLDESGVEVRP